MIDAYESQLNQQPMDNYQALAQRTSATPTPELISRMLNKYNLGGLAEILEEAADAGSRLDVLKKVIFYGKDITLPVESTLELPDKMKQFLVNESGRRIKILHGIIGLITEAGELAEAALRFLKQHEDFDFTNLKEEGGDNQWYAAELFEAIQTTFEEVQRLNIAKLASRYGDKFSELRAQNRDLNAERKVLEDDQAT
jgi:NTP pyrophosphatase (non-canonical NTP hydrolase)